MILRSYRHALRVRETPRSTNRCTSIVGEYARPHGQNRAGTYRLLAKFLQEAGGDPIRAEHLRLAYYKRLALKSAVARRKAKEFTAQAEAAEAELQGGGSNAAA